MDSGLMNPSWVSVGREDDSWTAAATRPPLAARRPHNLTGRADSARRPNRKTGLLRGRRATTCPRGCLCFFIPLHILLTLSLLPQNRGSAVSARRSPRNCRDPAPTPTESVSSRQKATRCSETALYVQVRGAVSRHDLIQARVRQTFRILSANLRE